MARTAGLQDYLPHRSLLILLAVLCLVIAPHLLRLPAWETASVLLLIVWRAVASARQWPLPPQILKLALALAALAAVYSSFGRVSGQNAGVALLVLMLALKLTEMRSRRDVIVVVFILYFLLLTHFLFSQEIWTIAYLLLSAAAITTALIDAHHPGSVLPVRTSARMGAGMLLKAIPVMLLMFVLFPRIPGPIWGLPNDAGAGKSGLSDSMTPGDIVNLIQSDEIAFRAKFDGEPPPPEKVYWRGPVFRRFAFRTWSPGPEDLRGPPPRIELGTSRVSYTLTLEPMRSRWLFALDMPDAQQLPAQSRIEPSGALVLDKPVTQRRLVKGVSSLEYRLQPQISPRQRRLNTELQQGWNPRTVQLALAWRAQSSSDAEIVQHALRLFREQEFVYTLQPPPLGRHSADDFLFETRRGFCEHYSSSFAVLMRAAGIPARVVTGYQGMEKNLLGDYYLVRQSDAHAWNEVWLSGRGWVRVDPTAAVAPERIEQGLRSAISTAEGLPSFLSGYGSLRYQIEARWELLNARWNGWVLGYGPEMQQRFLSHFGIEGMRNMLLALTFGISGFLALIGLIALRSAGPKQPTDEAHRLWQRLGKKLHRLGFDQRPDEGPRDFIERVIRREPLMESQLRLALEAYLAQRYAEQDDPELLRTLRQAPRSIRRSLG